MTFIIVKQVLAEYLCSMKNLVRISKKFEFEAAHALDGYDDLCKNIHGHSYQFSITLNGIITE